MKISRKWMIRSAIVLSVLLAILAIAWTIFSYVAADRLETELDKLRNAGVETDLAAMAPEEIPDELNAARIYKRAFALLEQPSQTENHLLDYNREATLVELKEKWTTKDRRAVRALLDRNKGALEALAEAAQFEQCRFPLRYEDPLGMLLPHLSSIGDAWRILRFRIVLESLEGNPEGAMTDLLTALALADSMKEEPLLVSFMYTVALRRQILLLAQEVMRSPEVTDEQLRSLKRRLDPGNLRERLVRSLQGEFCFGFSGYRLWEGSELGIGGFLSRPRMRWDMATRIDMFSRLIDAARLPYHESQSTVAQLSREAEGLNRWLNPITSIIWGTFPRTLEMAANAETLDTLAAAAIDLELQRRATGSLPETLEEPPIDPRTGNPIGYDPEAGLLTAGELEWKIRKE